MALCFVVLGGAALGFSLRQDKQYSASASLFFREAGLEQAVFGVPVLAPSNDPDREGTTNLKLVSLPVVGAQTARRLGRPERSVLGKVSVRQDGQSNVITVTATDHDPRFAARLANAFATEYIAFRQNADRLRIRQAQTLLERQIGSLPAEQSNDPQARLLRDRVTQLAGLASLQTGNAELVQRAEVPTSPSAPRPVRNLVLGCILGLMLGVAMALLLDRVDRRFKDPEEIEELFGRPILAVIPKSKAIQSAPGPKAPLPPVETDAFRMLRASRRYFEVDQEVRSLLITSAAPGDGKSTVAWNLAAAEAATGRRVVLIEADLRHPVLTSRYGIDGKGLSGVLVGEEPHTAVVANVPVQWSQDGDGPTMDVMPAGVIPPNPSDLLESERMGLVIRLAEEIYDLVVIDTPPTSVVSDAIPLLTQVGGVMIVVRLDKTPREACVHLHNQLENLGAPLLGLVVNGFDVRHGGYYGAFYGDHYKALPSPARQGQAQMPDAARDPPSLRWEEDAAARRAASGDDAPVSGDGKPGAAPEVPAPAREPSQPPVSQGPPAPVRDSARSNGARGQRDPRAAWDTRLSRLRQRLRR